MQVGIVKSFLTGQHGFLVNHFPTMQIGADTGGHIIFQIGGGQGALAVCESDSAIQKGNSFLDQVTEMTGIHMGRIRIIDMYIPPGFKCLGAVIDHTTVAKKQSSSLF